MIRLFLTRQIPLYVQSYFNVTSVVIVWCFITSYDVHLSHCAYTIVVCSVFIIMLRVLYFIKKCKSIYYHFRRDHESSSFRKLARNKWICRETCDFFFRDQFTLLAINLTNLCNSDFIKKMIIAENISEN